MHRPRSRDLRERALRPRDAGPPVAEVAAVFGVHRATLARWRQQRAAGADGPRPRRPRAAKLGPTARPRRVAQVRATPEATLREHCATWQTATGVAVRDATLCRALRKAGRTLNKRRRAPPSATRRCARCGARTSPRGTRPLSSSWTRPAPTRGSPGCAPRNHGPDVTLLAVLGPTGVVTALAIPGATTRPVFEAFVDRFLAPRLRPGQTVILDNLGGHTSAHAQARVEAAGGQVVFLPAYSPDFTPIEPIFAKIKAALRAAAARTPDDLIAATKAALDAVTAQDAAGCSADGGYPLTSHDA